MGAKGQRSVSGVKAYTTPYAEALGPRDALAVITGTPGRLRAVLARLTPEQIEAAPAPGKWSMREVMCHLADCEIAWAWRLRFAFEQDRGVLQPFEQDPWARLYGAYSLAAAQATFEALRAWNVAFAGALSEHDRLKPVLHPEYGEWPLWALVEVMAGHDLHHLRTLER